MFESKDMGRRVRGWRKDAGITQEQLRMRPWTALFLAGYVVLLVAGGKGPGWFVGVALWGAALGLRIAAAVSGEVA